MDRRDFLRQLSLYTAGALAAPPVLEVLSNPTFAASTPPTVNVVKGKNYEELTRRLLLSLGGMKKFVHSGDKVVIKPNIGWDRTPEQGANTHPLVVKTLVKMALEAGASKVQVFDRSCNEERRCYFNSGIKEAVESLGDKRATIPYVEERKFVPIVIKQGKALRDWIFYKEALEADCYINVPVAKHHSLAKLTLGLKNSMGMLGGNRGRIHQNMGQNLADIATVIRPKLTVVDATRILFRNGPVGGNLRDVKVLDTLIASTDPVAVDSYATTLFNLRPEEIDSIRRAYEFGLGEMDLKKIRVLEA